MLGIGIAVGPATEYEMNDKSSNDATGFFGALSIGDTLEVEDADADGTADVIELDD